MIILEGLSGEISRVNRDPEIFEVILLLKSLFMLQIKYYFAHTPIDNIKPEIRTVQLPNTVYTT